MPLPLLLAGAALGALFVHDKEKQHLARQDQNRYLKSHDVMGREPSEILPSERYAELVPGAIVCCEVFEAFIHTGIVIDQHTIVELHGNGLIRAISPQRFLAQRSGEHIFIACDQQGDPLVVEAATNRAAGDVYTHYAYDLFNANCYRHTWRWLTGEDKGIGSFEDFNRLFSKLHNQPIYWDCVV